MFSEFLDLIFRVKQEIWLFPYRARSRRVIADYLRNNARCVRINIGSGPNLIDGWLNGEIWPGKNTVYIDAFRKLPFRDDSVHFVNCEHLLEHLGCEASKKFLTECFRVLAGGGVLRISTPDLKRLIAIYLDRLEPPEVFLRHHNAYHGRDADNMCEWFNDHMRLWGHRFIFDETTLAGLLKKTGFSGIAKHGFGESRYPELQDIERHDEGAESMRGAYAYTVIFEAVKES